MSAEDGMQVNPQRAKQLAENIGRVVQQIQAANKASRNSDPPHRRLKAQARSRYPRPPQPAHEPSPLRRKLPPGTPRKGFPPPRSIQWHFIGALQTNKCKSLAEQIPNLFSVSSVDAAKKADALEKGRAALHEKDEDVRNSGTKLRVLVQVNTSGEESKSGVEPQDAAELCKHIREKCPHLHLGGLMTIGAIARSQATTAETENEDFVTLRETRDKVAEELGIAKEELELSMGMSSDFQGAITQGSDEVRVGTDIFGERPPRKDAKVKEDTEEEKK
ncbi:hypothetical protein H2203_000095 [Taxawa tesnikishii (nom. ined.)]|nr:hypothetical protein H2203_000095 [Dothideales sp. JES 119]